MKLLVFRTDVRGEPTRSSLTKLEQGERLIDWQWNASGNTALLALDASGEPQGFKLGEEEHSWSWVRSRDLPPPAMEDAPARAHRIRIVDLTSGSARNAELPRSERVRLERERGFDAAFAGLRNWSFSQDGENVFVRLRDERVESIYDPYLQELMRANAPEARSFAAARSSALSVNIATGAVRELFKADVGRITNMISDRDGESFVTIQAAPAHATWPMHSQWGGVYWVGSDGRRGNEVDVVPLESTLFASDRAGVIYQYDPFHRRLYEVSRTPAQRQELGPRGRTIASLEVSRDGRAIVAVVEAANTPPSVQIWTTATRTWRVISEPGAKWRNPGNITVEHLSWPSADGVFEPDGLLVKPRNFDAKRKYPLIVLMKGGMATSTHASTTASIRFSARTWRVPLPLSSPKRATWSSWRIIAARNSAAPPRRARWWGTTASTWSSMCSRASTC